ncbi:hypothetical protein H1C71_025510 [Ictidomys tridecemlineatus]|nr:hypothetical protein H1C71_025510 [Ictidomys tridecemlineatus]
MAALEITLGVILILLGLAILAILLTRWTRSKQNEIDVSRYSSEQSTGLLDYEDDSGSYSKRTKKGKGSRHSYSTESDFSNDDRGQSGTSIVSRQGSTNLPSTSSLNTAHPKRTATSEPIGGVIGPIMQFTAPIPGATGPIRLSQKTIVQTPGPIVQYTGPGDTDFSSLFSSVFPPDSNSGSESSSDSSPYATCGQSSTSTGPQWAPLAISQRITTKSMTSTSKFYVSLNFTVVINFLWYICRVPFSMNVPRGAICVSDTLVIF